MLSLFLIYFYFPANLGTFVYIFDAKTGQKIRNKLGESMFTACDGQHRCQYIVCDFKIITFFFPKIFIFIAQQMEKKSIITIRSNWLLGHFKSPFEF